MNLSLFIHESVVLQLLMVTVRVLACSSRKMHHFIMLRSNILYHYMQLSILYPHIYFLLINTITELLIMCSEYF